MYWSTGGTLALPVAAWRTRGGRISTGRVSAGAGFVAADSAPNFQGYIGPEQSEQDNPATWFAPVL